MSTSSHTPTDWRELCRELLAALENAIGIIYHEGGTQHISTADPLIAKVDAALAATPDGPAVPSGREPASVAEEPTSPPDWRGLCEELAEYLDTATDPDELGIRSCQVVARLRSLALLPQPEPEVAGPSDEELRELYLATMLDADRDEDDFFAFARAVIAADRARRPAPEPVPVSERLPGPKDCDAEGRCWWLTLDWEAPALWKQSSTVTHWLPANALPLPGREVK